MRSQGRPIVIRSWDPTGVDEVENTKMGCADRGKAAHRDVDERRSRSPKLCCMKGVTSGAQFESGLRSGLVDVEDQVKY